MINCAVCLEDISQKAQCPRCGYDNSKLGEVNQTLAYFGSIWGVLSLLLVFPPLLMLMPGIFTVVDTVLQPVASVRVGGPISLLVTAIIAFYLFSLRNAIHHYSRTRTFKATPGRPVALWALIFFIASILLIFFLAFAVTSKESIVGPEGYSKAELEGLLVYGSTGHLLFKLLMTGFLVFIFVFLSLSAGMMAAYVYGNYMASHFPTPIFLNEALLIRVVLDTVGKQMTEDVELTISGMRRLENGGISLSLACDEELTTQGSDTVQKSKIWSVDADCWGRVNKIEEKGWRLIKAS